MSKTPVVPVQKFHDLQLSLDQSSYEWLAANESVILAAIEREVSRGVQPREMRMFVVREYGREDIAARIEQAARHVIATNSDR